MSHQLAGLDVIRVQPEPVTLWEIAMRKITLTKRAMKKITLTAAVATALLFALAAGTASVPINSPGGYVFGHYGSLAPVW